MNNEEKILMFFLNKYDNSINNKISFSKKEIPQVNMSEQDIIRSIYLLQTDGLLNIVQKSIHDDFKIFWIVELTSKGVHYFENKKKCCTKNAII